MKTIKTCGSVYPIIPWKSDSMLHLSIVICLINNSDMLNHLVRRTYVIHNMCPFVIKNLENRKSKNTENITKGDTPSQYK